MEYSNLSFLIIKKRKKSPLFYYLEELQIWIIL
nr:MAG TPA: hypothetical protein [Caudoviricetes sp.]